MKKENIVIPPKSWRQLDTHFIKVFEFQWYRHLAEIQSLITVLTYQFYFEKGINTVQLPITTGSISSPMGLGSDSLPVKVKLDNVDTYLADSMQFMLEYMCRIFKTGCYYIMPSFRGENADKRHLCQFYHSEAEIPGTFHDVMKLVEEYIRFLSKGMLEKYTDGLLKICNGNIEHIKKIAFMNTPIKKITFNQAVEVLGNNPKYVNYNEVGFRTLTNSGEKKLIEIFNGILWVTNFDKLSVPFYQALDEADTNSVLNADLLFGIGEIVGAGERHTTGIDVIKALKEHSVNENEYSWYIEMKKQYPMQTAGFGLGVERFILWLTNQNDIRDCQIFPRFNGINIVP